VYSSQGRFWLTMVGVFAAGCVGCNQPAPKTAPGHLPQAPRDDAEPRVNATTYFAHGHLLERQGQFEQAAAQYRRAVMLQPRFLSARNRLGITLNKLGQHAEATDQFQQAIADHPERAYLHNNLGFSLYLEGEHGAAEQAFKQALALKPGFPRAHMNHALVLARLQRFDEAFAELMLVGNEADAYFNMGMILTDAEHYAEAARYLEAALALRPDLAAARQQLREVSRLAAEWEARQAAQVALAADATTSDAQPAAEARSAPLTGTAEAAATEQYAREPGIDLELLFAMIDDAVRALENCSDDFETLWCRIGYYLFPETAPDPPFEEAE
jgi:Flp pilus assembly protein TadD